MLELFSLSLSHSYIFFRNIKEIGSVCEVYNIKRREREYKSKEKIFQFKKHKKNLFHLDFFF